MEGDALALKLMPRRSPHGPAEMHIYIDESIHVRGDFIVVAAVYSIDDLKEPVQRSLSECGFDPNRDEFKSSMTMRGNPTAQRLRDRLQGILGSCKLAIAVCPVDERSRIMAYAGNLITTVAPHVAATTTAYFDQGIKHITFEPPPNTRILTDCDSKKVAGIQVADCAAHLISTILLADLGLTEKKVPANTVYPDDDGEIELAWTLWAAIRWALASNRLVCGPDADELNDPNLHPFGLLISETCSPAVKAAAGRRLGTIWLGCIH